MDIRQTLQEGFQKRVHDQPHTYGAIHQQSRNAVAAEFTQGNDKKDKPCTQGNGKNNKILHATSINEETEYRRDNGNRYIVIHALPTNLLFCLQAASGSGPAA